MRPQLFQLPCIISYVADETWDVLGFLAFFRLVKIFVPDESDICCAITIGALNVRIEGLLPASLQTLCACKVVHSSGHVNLGNKAQVAQQFRASPKKRSPFRGSRCRTITVSQAGRSAYSVALRELSPSCPRISSPDAARRPLGYRLHPTP